MKKNYRFGYLKVFAVLTLGFTAVKAQTISTYTGNGINNYSGDGGLANAAQINQPNGIYVDAKGNLYITDSGNNRIRKIDGATGIISTIVGDGNWGVSGDGGQAINAQIDSPYGICADEAGNVYFADQANHRIRKVDASGVISTIIGNGIAGYAGDGGQAINAQIKYPTGICLDGQGNLIFADFGNHVIRQLSLSTGIINTIAGNGNLGYSGDGSLATHAQLQNPSAVCVDANKNIYISDRGNSAIRKIDAATGNIIAVAGYGASGFNSDGVDAKLSKLDSPQGIFISAVGDLYISDFGNDRVRVIDHATGIIQTFAGKGLKGYQGDGGPAADAYFNGIMGVSGDAAGNLYICDKKNNRIRKVTPSVFGINSFDGLNESINLYPNPTTDYIIVAGINERTSLKVYNDLGQVIYQTELTEDKKIDLHNFTKGIYTISMENNKGRKLQKILIGA